jgi:hypothetical protein
MTEQQPGQLKRYFIAVAIEIPIVFILTFADAFLFDGAILPWALYVIAAPYIFCAMFYVVYATWNPFKVLSEKRRD